jgi:membrane-bound inhibitor of C-type lysozyme
VSRGPRAPSGAVACLALAAGLAACARAEPPAAREVGFVCADGETIVAAYPVGGEAVVLDVEGEHVELPRVFGGAGARYSDGTTTTFFTTESGAVLERSGKTYSDCIRSEVPSRRWVRFGAKNEGSTLRWPGYAGSRRTVWQWSDLRRALR